MSKDVTAQPSRLLEDKLAAVRAKHLNVGVGTGVAWLAVAAVALLTGGMLLDWKLDLDKSVRTCLLYTSPSPRDATLSRMPSSA